MIWSVFKDTAANKQKAEDAVLKKAKKKGKLDKYQYDAASEQMKALEELQNDEGSKNIDN